MPHSASKTEGENAQYANSNSTNDVGGAHLHTDSFVLSVWLEETAQEAKRAKWRGRITHVSSGNYCYLRNLQEVVSFVAAYLEKWGVTFNLWAHLRCWLATQGYGPSCKERE